MNVEEAVKIAKNWVAAMYSDEAISNVGLEEVVMDKDVWRVTIGFSRP